MRPKRSAQPKLGRLEKIHPGDYWQNDSEFQHWLAEPDNLELLGEAVGFDLATGEADATQDEDSGYLRLQEKESQALVLVSTQLATTDASHLGQLLTWAATEAVALVIWVAPEFSADQARTLDWLNHLSQGAVDFLGVETELWSIGKNAMAVNFKLVCEPGGATSGAADPGVEAATAAESTPEPEPEPEPLTELQQENLDFWGGLCDRMDRRGSIVKPGAPTPEAAMGFAMARAGFRLYAILDRDHGSLHTELLLSGADAHPHFYLLAREQSQIAHEINLPLFWDDSGEQTCAIASTLLEVDLTDRDRWPDYQAWFFDCLDQFYEVFFDRVKYLNAAEYQPMPNYDTDAQTDSLSLPVSRRT